MEDNRELALWRFKNLLNKDIVIMGLATTGDSLKDELIEVAIIDLDGNILMDQRIRPTVSVSNESGVSLAELVDEPSYLSVYIEILEIVNKKVVCIYNADYGARIIRQTSEKYNVESPLSYAEDLFCVMENYSEIKEDYDIDWSKKKYTNILEVAEDEMIEWDSDRGHSSLSDALIIKKMIGKYH